MSLLRYRAAAFLVWACVFGWARAEQVQQLPQPTSYVSDFAGVIDPASRQNLEQIAAQVESKTHATIEIATIKSLDGQDIDEFTTALEDKWKVGPRGSDKGILMVFAIKEHKDRVEVGYGLEGILNDAKVGDIRRSMNPELEQGEYGPGIQLGTQEIANVIAADAGVTLTPPSQQPPVQQQAPVQHHGSWIGPVLFLIFLLLIFRGGGGGRGGWLWFLLGNMMGGGFGGGGRGGGFGGGGDGDGGGGGGGGGGDFGGGFGGGSGGGGASGDW